MPVTAQVITANRLVDGLVVWFAPGGSWVLDVARAEVFAAAETVTAALEVAQAAVAARAVVDPYAVDVDSRDGRVTPKSLREKIRAGGPTTPSEFRDAVRSKPAA